MAEVLDDAHQKQTYMPQAVVFIGIQGSGKSTFYKQQFADTHLRLNLDMLRTRHRERILLKACLSAKQSFVIDNTNPTKLERERYIIPAKAARFRVVGCYFHTEPQAALRRNAERDGRARVPDVAIWSTTARLEPPTWDEGFDMLYDVQIDVNGGFLVSARQPDLTSRDI